jgi:hypothetical protein
MRYRMFLMSAITHLSAEEKFITQTIESRRRSVSSVSATIPPSSFLRIFAIVSRGLGWHKFTVEIKNNAFQNDTLNTERRQSGDNSSI